jgi:hypothetical protein
VTQFAEASIRNKENLSAIITILTNAVMNDVELPVKVEAAMAIQMLLVEQEAGASHMFNFI